MEKSPRPDPSDPVRVLYLVYYGFEKTVIESQVITPASKLSGLGVAVHLLFLEDFTDWVLLRWRKKRRSLRGLPATFLPRIPRNFLYGNTLMTGLVIFATSLCRGRLVVHARGFQGAESVLPIKKLCPAVRIICDARGIESEEYDLHVRFCRKRPPNPIETSWKRRLESVERDAISRADAIFSVSRPMKDFFAKRDGIGSGEKWHYVPCAVDVSSFELALSRRDQMRETHGMRDRKVILYSGSLTSWQTPQQLLKIIQAYRKIDASVFFLGLTTENLLLKRLLVEAGLKSEDFLITRTDLEGMANWLTCGDIGLLIREDNVVNRYACPTKFAEYLASGLHVLSTPAVLDVARIIRDEKVGTIAEAIEPAESELKESLRSAAGRGRIERSVAVARKYLDWSIYLPEIADCYRFLAKGD